MNDISKNFVARKQDRFLFPELQNFRNNVLLIEARIIECICVEFSEI